MGVTHIHILHAYGTTHRRESQNSYLDSVCVLIGIFKFKILALFISTTIQFYSLNGLSACQGCSGVQIIGGASIINSMKCLKNREIIGWAKRYD